MTLRTFLFTISLCCTQLLIAQQNDLSNNSSPYFQVNTEGIGGSDFPLLSTTADVNITGPIASVTVTQTYQNNGTVPIEAIYVFPASTRAAVYEMSMYIGDRIIKADIQEKNQAKQTYEKAKAEGKRASLLEQSRPNVFQMSVGNILPDDIIKVELKYNEFLIPESKIYSFVYPTVVGPKFVDSKHLSAQDASVVNTPYSKEKIDPTYDFDIIVDVNGGEGMVLNTSVSPSHKVNVDREGPSAICAKLDASEKKGGNKDFIFNYSFAGDKISNGTFLYSHKGENFFLTMLEPPARMIDNEIPAREYIFVVDVSGSMYGFPIDVSKELMKDLVSKLRPIDKFNVLQFSGGSRLFAEKSVLANEENLGEVFNFIDNMRGGGGTQILNALERALALPSDEVVNSRSIVVVTDGYVHVEREAFELISKNLNKSNLFAFGIGKSVNRHLIEGMAHVGQGEAFVITDIAEAPKQAKKFRKYIEHPLLTNIDISFENLEVYDVIPETVPDLLAERPLYIFGKYKGTPKGQIKIKGAQGNRMFNKTIQINPEMEKASNSPIRYLWAREKIRFLDDLNNLSQSEASVKEVTDLGLKYNLLTKYTSFVAVEENPVLANGQNTKTVKQVLPMPEGVSNHAIGFEMKIDGIVEISEEEEKKSYLHVHVSGQENQVFQKQLKEKLSQAIVFTAKEKSFLNGNTLIVSYNAKLKIWEVKDNSGRISKAFTKQFKELLQQILKEKSKSFTIKISMLWV